MPTARRWATTTTAELAAGHLTSASERDRCDEKRRPVWAAASLCRSSGRELRYLQRVLGERRQCPSIGETTEIPTTRLTMRVRGADANEKLTRARLQSRTARRDLAKRTFEALVRKREPMRKGCGASSFPSCEGDDQSSKQRPATHGTADHQADRCASRSHVDSQGSEKPSSDHAGKEWNRLPKIERRPGTPQPWDDDRA